MIDEKLIAERTREYWVPGAAGVAIEAALRRLVEEQTEMVLTIRKRKSRDGWVITVTIGAPGTAP